MKKREILSKLHPFVTQNKNMSEEELKAINMKIDEVAKMTKKGVAMYIAPQSIKDAVAYIDECHKDMGFMGSPRYTACLKEIEDYLKPYKK